MTQKQILSQYAKQQGLLNTEFYIDDGYSGTNYDRPDFKRMESDIETGKIGTVITKDLSRLGRDYLKTGYYVEVLFPEYDVRYIAVNDSVDTSTGDNEFMPFKNIIKKMCDLRRVNAHFAKYPINRQNILTSCRFSFCEPTL
jgi:DNA invertase Pin-like site-specific DNA recombinase